MCCDGRQDFLKPVFLRMGMLVQSDVLVFIFFIISSKTVDSIPALLQQRQLQLRAPDVQRPGGRDFVWKNEGQDVFIMLFRGTNVPALAAL